MTVNIEKEMHTMVMSIEGSLDYASVGVLKNLIYEHSDGTKNIDIDMKGITSISEEGFLGLQELENEIRGIKYIRMFNVNDQLRGKLELYGFTDENYI